MPRRRQSTLGTPDSTTIVRPVDGSREWQMDHVACCHCGRHHQITTAAIHAAVAGGKPLELGFCQKCGHPTCASEPCASTCTPLEQQLENMEAGRHPLTPRPAFEAFPFSLPFKEQSP